MRKFFAMLLVLVMAMAFVGCGASEPEAPAFDPLQKAEGTMTYAEYAAADLDSPVPVECIVQGNQSWWDN